MTAADCQVYWGSHGCALERDHSGHHHCDCCTCADHETAPNYGCVGGFPYYGTDITQFYGADAARG